MEARKLIKFGNSSHVLALPHEWLKENNLTKGDLVYLSKNGSNELIVAPAQKEVKKELKVKSINIDGKDIDRIRREIIAAYLKDFNVIKLNGNEIEKKTPEIRGIVHNFIALEILEQNKNNIVARDFLNLEAVSIKKLVNKMDMLTRSMFAEININLKKEQCHSIITRDNDVNRIYFLAMRCIKAALNNEDLRKKINYSFNELFYYWHMLYHIESISDKLKGLAWFFSKINLNEKFSESIMALYKKIEKHYIDCMKSYYFKDPEAALKLANAKNKLIKECDVLLNKKNLDKNTIRLLDKLKTIIRKIHNMYREVYDTYC